MRSTAASVIRHLVALAIIAALVAGACGTPKPRALGPGERWLSVEVWERDGQTFLCSGGGVSNVVLRGHPDDPRLVWAQRLPDGDRIDVAWPDGYSARFAPSLEVLDERGDVVGREGSAVTGTCLTAEPGIHSVSLAD